MATAQVAPVTPIEKRGYAHPEKLVSTDWVAQHLKDPKVRLVESNEDILLYDTGHIPGAVKVDWTSDLNDPLTRDYIDRERLQKLLRAEGDQRRHHDRLLRRQEQLVGDLRALGARAVRHQEREGDGRRPAPLGGRGPAALDRRAVLSGRQHHRRRAGRQEDPRLPGRGARASEAEEPAGGRAESRGVPGARRPTCPSTRRKAASGAGTSRAPRAFRGRRRSTRRPTPSSPPNELRKLYEQDNSLKKDQETIAYCRIGERSSHTWFALTYLLGFDKVRNYDGSWTEWGNAVRLPVER